MNSRLKDELHDTMVKMYLAMEMMAPAQLTAAQPVAPKPAPITTEITAAPVSYTTDEREEITDFMLTENKKAEKEYKKQQKQMKKNIKKTGYDIRYNPDNDTFSASNGGQVFTLTADELNPEKIRENYEQTYNEAFSHETIYHKKNVTLDQALSDDGCEFAHYNDADNSVQLNYVTEEGKDKAVQMIVDMFGMSKNEATKAVEDIYKEMQSPDFQKSILAHELSHRDDHQNKIFAPDISFEHLTRLQMLTEVKATMTQAGLALEHYQKTGDMSHFKFPNLTEMTQDIKKLQRTLELPQYKNNPKKQKELVGQYTFQCWMREFNKPDSQYSAIAPMQAGVTLMLNNGDVMAEYLRDTDKSVAEYQARVTKMFSNITGLGDMTKCINPDFKLNEQLSADITRHLDYGFNDLMSDSPTFNDAGKKMLQLLELIKDADKDGTRTKAEQKAINQAILAMKKDNFTADGKTISWMMAQKMAANR